MEKKNKVYMKQQLEIIKYEADKFSSAYQKKYDKATLKNHSLPQDDPKYNVPLPHTIYNPILREYLAQQNAGFRFFADVSEKEQTWGMSYNIVQVYREEGTPVSEKKKGGGGYGKSPEITRMEIEAKFRNTALMHAVDCSKARVTVINTGGPPPLLETKSILFLADEFYGWLTGGAVTAQKPASEKPVPEKKPAADPDWEKLKREHASPLARLKACMDGLGYKSGEVMAYSIEKYGKGKSEELNEEEIHELIKAMYDGKIKKGRKPTK